MSEHSFCKKFAGLAGSLSADQIVRRRKVVIDLIEQRIKDDGLVLNTKNINQVFTARMLDYMISLIDEHFFENELMVRFRENKCCLTACMENRCTSVGGKCYRKGKTFTIKLSTKVIYNAFEKDRINRKVNDVECKSILKCMLLIFEHELTHAILGCDCRESAYSNDPSVTYSNYPGDSRPGNGHSKTFMGVVNNRFGHTAFKHHIRGQDPSMAGKKRYKKEDLKKGDAVIIKLKIPVLNKKDEYKGITAPATITKLLKKSFNCEITDRGFLDGFGYKTGPVVFENVKYVIIDSKQFELAYESGAEPKANVPKAAMPKAAMPKAAMPKAAMPKAAVPKADVPKTDCNKRNPAPPCPAGMHEKARPNGSICCYKGELVPAKAKKYTFKVKTPTKPKTFKFTVKQPHVKPKVDVVKPHGNPAKAGKPKVDVVKPKVDVVKPKVDVVKTKPHGNPAKAGKPKVDVVKPKVDIAGKCNNRNPAPPCTSGMTIKRRPDGTKCCYKTKTAKQKKYTPKEVVLTSKVSNELYELDFAYKPIFSDDVDSRVRYEQLSSGVKKYLEKVETFTWNKPLTESRKQTDNKHPVLNNSSPKLDGVKNKFYLIKIHETRDKDTNNIQLSDTLFLIRNEGYSYVRYAIELYNYPQTILGKSAGNLW
jgi:hypothetical protein